MKLYRGLKEVFQPFTSRLQKRYKDLWDKVLKTRKNKKYPEQLNKEILELQKLQKLAVQHFTDNKEIAYRYGKYVVEITVPDIKHFTVEFQNFSKRKTNFEIVYCVKGEVLHRLSKEWKLTIH